MLFASDHWVKFCFYILSVFWYILRIVYSRSVVGQRALKSSQFGYHLTKKAEVWTERGICDSSKIIFGFNLMIYVPFSFFKYKNKYLKHKMNTNSL